jgi:hypothetical protein
LAYIKAGIVKEITQQLTRLLGNEVMVPQKEFRFDA